MELAGRGSEGVLAVALHSAVTRTWLGLSAYRTRFAPGSTGRLESIFRFWARVLPCLFGFCLLFLLFCYFKIISWYASVNHGGV